MQAYFQFEMSMLAFGTAPSYRLAAICYLCCFRMGAHVRDKLEAGEMEGDIEARLKRVTQPPSEFDPDNADHVQLVLGMTALNVCNGNAPYMIRIAKEAERFHVGMVRRFGNFPFVRLRADIFWEAHKGKLPWRDVSVLCALYGTIGAHDGPVRIVRDMIATRSMGYKRKADMTSAELKKRADKASPLTTDQIRYTLDRLEARNLFARVQVSRRMTVFSNRMNRAELAEAAVKRYGKPHAVKTNRASDKSVMETIKRKQVAYHSGGKLTPTTDSPVVPTGVPTGSPLEHPLESPLR